MFRRKRRAACLLERFFYLATWLCSPLHKHIFFIWQMLIYIFRHRHSASSSLLCQTRKFEDEFFMISPNILVSFNFGIWGTVPVPCHEVSPWKVKIFQDLTKTEKRNAHAKKKKQKNKTAHLRPAESETQLGMISTRWICQKKVHDILHQWKWFPIASCDDNFIYTVSVCIDFGIYFACLPLHFYNMASIVTRMGWNESAQKITAHLNSSKR